MTKKWSVMALTLLPAASFAHPGHDHSHWTSAMTHSILLMSVLAVAAVGVKLISNRSKASDQEENS